MHRCPCALTFPSLNDLRLHQDRCAKFASLIKLPSSKSRTRATNAKASSSSLEHGAATSHTDDEDRGLTTHLASRSKATGQGSVNNREQASGNSTSQRKRTSLATTKKTSSSQNVTFASARMSPHNSKVKASKQKVDVTVPGSSTFAAEANVVSAKSTSGRVALWQHMDQEMALSNKAKIKSNGKNFLVPGRMRGLRKEAKDEIDIQDPTHLRANISPRLRLVINGIEESGSDSDETAQPHRYRRRVTVAEEVNLREPAADEPLDVPMGSPSPGPGAADDFEEQTDDITAELDPESVPLPPQPKSRPRTLLVPAKQKAARKLHSFDASDSESEQAPQNTVSDSEPLDDPPQADRFNRQEASPTPPAHNRIDTDEGPVVLAIDKEEGLNRLKAACLTLPSLRMQSTKQLPFLRRNLVTGFLGRCQRAHIPIYPDSRPFSLKFRYEHVDDIFYEASVGVFSCPLCSLFGIFQTREMLECHLSWDHPEIVHEWQLEDTQQNMDSWRLKVLIPEPTDQNNVEENVLAYEDRQDIDPTTPITEGRSAYDLSILPYVALSPPRSPEPVRPSDSAQEANRSTSLSPVKKEEIYEPSVTLSVSRSAPSPHQSSLTSTLHDKQVTYNNPNLLPPNPENPLGPAARHPYLPAKSVYDGPTVYYSCRPGGPCLFDLLGTLPLKEFGLLVWEVLDREEEIYESDDIKEEYKIMHALWARWILLNRVKFVANYVQGVMRFIDKYYEFIHMASGWDGLRYWLLMLHANRFLTPTEVAKSLAHYEKLTGMSGF